MFKKWYNKTYVTKESLREFDGDETLARKMVMSKLAGFFDLRGFANPLKSYGKAILQQIRKKKNKDTDMVPIKL